MRLKTSWWLPGVLAVGVLLSAGPAAAQIYTQRPPATPASPNPVYIHLAAGDGFVLMADGHLQYIFGFQEVPVTVPDADVMTFAELGAQFPAPTLVMDEGTQVYLNLSNVGMPMRPDLFDAHSVHFHGFPQAAPVFDGLPESSVTIKMGATFTYFYNLVEPGTYLYHCHVEATEHMQMGMLGNLYVRPRQDCDGTQPLAQRCGGGTGAPLGYAYNDGDGSTRYDVEAALQVSGFDSIFHDAHIAVQPLPFAAMKDNYAMINGRGYPDTIVPGTIPAPPSADNGGKNWNTDPRGGPQPVTSRITASAGQRILLRLSNLSVQALYTIQSPGIAMEVVGVNARLLKGPGGRSLYYKTHSVNLGGGESMDIILDTTGLAAGTYFLYTTNLNYLSNYNEDLGGAMTEIIIQ